MAGESRSQAGEFLELRLELKEKTGISHYTLSFYRLVAQPNIAISQDPFWLESFLEESLYLL